ncbi:hypothetical protein Gotur_003182 [Gossypium turneri]
MEEIVEAIDSAFMHTAHDEHLASCNEKMDPDCGGSHWSPPKECYVKLNIDGVVFSSRACAFIGGVEVKAMLEGIHLAWNKGFQKLELECDNALLVEIILAGGAANSKLMELRLIHHMLIRS